MARIRAVDSPGLRAAIVDATRAAVREAGAIERPDPWAALAMRLGADLPVEPAVRFDGAWFARQVATRHAFIRTHAKSLGLDEDEALRRFGGQASPARTEN